MFSKKYFLKETRGLKAKERKKEKDAKLLFHNIMAHDLKKLPVRGSYFITNDARKVLAHETFGNRKLSSGQYGIIAKLFFTANN